MTGYRTVKVDRDYKVLELKEEEIDFVLGALAYYANDMGYYGSQYFELYGNDNNGLLKDAETANRISDLIRLERNLSE